MVKCLQIHTDVDLFLIEFIDLCCRLLFIDTDFHTLKLKGEDSGHRQHVCTVKLKSKVDIKDISTYTFYSLII